MRLKLIFDLDQFIFDFLKPEDHVVFVVQVARILFELSLGTFKGKALFLDQEEDHLQILEIFLGEESIPFLVFLRTQNVEFVFPKANQGGIHPEGLGDFADSVVSFFW